MKIEEKLSFECNMNADIDTSGTIVVCKSIDYFVVNCKSNIVISSLYRLGNSWDIEIPKYRFARDLRD